MSYNIDEDIEDDDSCKSAPGHRVVGRPFKPGESGNPAGRPKGKGINDYMREYLNYCPLEWKILCSRDDLTPGEEIARQAVQKALADVDDWRRIDNVINHTTGKPVQRVEQKVGGLEDSSPVIIIIEPVKAIDHKNEDT